MIIIVIVSFIGYIQVNKNKCQIQSQIYILLQNIYSSIEAKFVIHSSRKGRFLDKEDSRNFTNVKDGIPL